jgi:hypothetical protein
MGKDMRIHDQKRLSRRVKAWKYKKNPKREFLVPMITESELPIPVQGKGSVEIPRHGWPLRRERW